MPTILRRATIVIAVALLLAAPAVPAIGGPSGGGGRGGTFGGGGGGGGGYGYGVRGGGGYGGGGLSSRTPVGQPGYYDDHRSVRAVYRAGDDDRFDWIAAIVFGIVALALAPVVVRELRRWARSRRASDASPD